MVFVCEQCLEKRSGKYMQVCDVHLNSLFIWTMSRESHRQFHFQKLLQTTGACPRPVKSFMVGL